jgi:hypothetical protein
LIEHIPKPPKDKRPKFALLIFLGMLAVPMVLSVQFGYQATHAELASNGLGADTATATDAVAETVAGNGSDRFRSHGYRGQRKDRHPASDAIDQVVSLITKLVRG